MLIAAESVGYDLGLVRFLGNHLVKKFLAGLFAQFLQPLIQWNDSCTDSGLTERGLMRIVRSHCLVVAIFFIGKPCGIVHMHATLLDDR